MLFLIPAYLSEESPVEYFAPSIKEYILKTDYFFVENEKTARRFIKSVLPEKVQSTLRISLLNKHTDSTEYSKMITPCLSGMNVGLMSEAGCPGVADPGAVIVKLAHEKGIQVVPLVGPSSILSAMMASGMNGHNFAFNGYLPIDSVERKNKLLQMESFGKKGTTQIFMDTPFRNQRLLEEIIQYCKFDSMLCIACNVTAKDEYIKTLPLAEWKKRKPDLNKKPAIFIFGK